MRNINNDLTLKRNYLNKYRFLINEYEQVKRREHPLYRFAKDFYSAHDTDARAFLKYYNLFKRSGNELDLLPQKRGPKYGSRRPSPSEEQQVLELVEQGCKNKEIAQELGIRPGTVKIHLKHIFEKSGVRGRYGLALSGLRQRYAPVPRRLTA